MKRASTFVMLSALLASHPAFAFQCPAGDAKVALGPPQKVVWPSAGEGPALSATGYSVLVDGYSSISYSDLLNLHQLDSLVMFLTYKAGDPVSVRFDRAHEVPHRKCLMFKSWKTDTSDRRGFMAVSGGKQGDGPDLCFAEGNKVHLQFFAELNSVVPLGAQISPGDLNVHILVEQTSSGEDVALIDTEGARCVENS